MPAPKLGQKRVSEKKKKKEALEKVGQVSLKENASPSI